MDRAQKQDKESLKLCWLHGPHGVILHGPHFLLTPLLYSICLIQTLHAFSGNKQVSRPGSRVMYGYRIVLLSNLLRHLKEWVAEKSLLSR